MRSRMLRASALGIVFVVLFAVMAPVPFGPVPAFAATITVNTLEDSFVANGNCSLREAISSANLNVAFDACTAGTAGLDTITISVPGTITIAIPGKGEQGNATGDFDIIEPLVIVGQGVVLGASPATGTTINGNGVDRVFDVQGPPVVGASLTLRNLQVREGN